MNIEAADFMIVGGGVAGAVAAYELSRVGKALLIEREPQPGYHATGRSAALFEPSYGGAVAGALALASQEFLHEPPEGFAEHRLLRPRGTLYIADLGDEKGLAEISRGVATRGRSLQQLSTCEAIRRVPILREAAIGGAILDPETYDIEVHDLHHGYLRGLRKRRGRLITDTEVQVAVQRAGVWRLDTQRGAFEAPVIVNAAGAWGDEVAVMAGVRPLGLQSLRRTVVLVDAPPSVPVDLWPHVESIRDGFYFKPESGRLLVSPADETPSVPIDVQPDEIDVAVAVARLESMTRLDVRHIRHKWAGLRTFLPDRIPAIGFDAVAEGFFWLCGLGGFGIMTAPAVGQCCVEMIVHGALPASVLRRGITSAMISPARDPKMTPSPA